MKNSSSGNNSSGGKSKNGFGGNSTGGFENVKGRGAMAWKKENGGEEASDDEIVQKWGLMLPAEKFTE